MLEEASLPERKERRDRKVKAKEKVLAAAAAKYAVGANVSKTRATATATTSGVEVLAAMDMVGNSDANAAQTTLRRREMGTLLATIMLLTILIVPPRLI